MAELISTQRALTARFNDFNVVAYRKPMATARGNQVKIPDWLPFAGFAPLETIESPECKSYIEARRNIFQRRRDGVDWNDG